MGVWATYCCICGAPLLSVDIEYPNLEKQNIHFPKESWLDKIGALIKSGKYIFGDYDSMGAIEAFGKIYYIYHYIFHPSENEKLGFGMHRVCYDLVKSIPNVFDKLNSFKRDKKISGYLVGLDYRPLTKYSGQFFNGDKIFGTKDMYALKNPLYNSENMKRIKKNISVIKNKIINPKNFIDEGNTLSLGRRRTESQKYVPRKRKSESQRRKEREQRSKSKSRRSKQSERRSKSPYKSKSRKGPTESATLFSVGTKKKGNDGNMWIIKKNIRNIKRWVKI